MTTRPRAEARDLPHLAARVFGVPLLADERKLNQLIPAFINRLNGGVDDEPEGNRASNTGMQTVNGVAVLPIIGSLIRRPSLMDFWSGRTSYTDISEDFRTALADPRVRAIMLQLDTCGGEAPGCFELCDELFAGRGDKPIWAVADVTALSAGYAILCQADRVICDPLGEVGSIGAVTVHMERSQQNENIGLTYTIIRAGLRKAEFNSLEPLTKAAYDKVAASLEKVRTRFVNTVVRARPALTARVVRGTEAQWYDPDDAQGLKLIDAVQPFDEAFAELAASVALAPSQPTTAPRPVPAPAPVEPDDDDDEGEEDGGAGAMEPNETTGGGAPAAPVAPQPAPAATGNVVNLDTARAEGAEAYAVQVKEISDMCTLARKPQLLADYLGRRMSPAAVKEDLMKRAVDDDTAIGDINNKHNGLPGGQRSKVNAAELWDQGFARARQALGQR